jgi:hypothetical protein
MTMNKRFSTFKVIAFGLVLIVCIIDLSCSSGDEPKPVNCDNSDLLITFVSKTDLTSCSVNNGSITVSATGGAEPYTYSKDGAAFQNSATFNNLGSGNYTITVKDKNGCTKTLTPNVSITSPNGPVITQIDQTADNECDSDDGTITITATGSGTLMYSRNGTTFQESNVFSSLRAGTYSITVKDDQGCTTVEQKVVANGTGVDYDTDMLPLFQTKCQFDGCHPTNGNWFDYNTAKSKASEIKSRTQSGDMPRTGSLSAAEKALIACWVDHGAPKN